MRRGITRIARRRTAGLLAAAALVALVPLSAAAQASSRGVLPRLTQVSHGRLPVPQRLGPVRRTAR